MPRPWQTEDGATTPAAEADAAWHPDCQWGGCGGGGAAARNEEGEGEGHAHDGGGGDREGEASEGADAHDRESEGGGSWLGGLFHSSHSSHER